MRKSKAMALTAPLLFALAGCASTAPTFAVPLDCQRQPTPQPGLYPEGPSQGRAGRSMSPDCLERIDNSRLGTPPR